MILIDIKDFRKRKAERLAQGNLRSGFASASSGSGSRDASVCPYTDLGHAPLDRRICLAVRSSDAYTVLQFSGNTDLAEQTPEVTHLSAADFNTQYSPTGSTPLTQKYYDIFSKHTHGELKRAGLYVTVCRPVIKAVHEVTESGVWEPASLEPVLTVDEGGWRPIDRSVQVHKDELIIEYLSGKYDHGPKQDMLARLMPRSSPSSSGPGL